MDKQENNSEQLAEQKDTVLDVNFNDKENDEDCEVTSKHASEENINTMHMDTDTDEWKSGDGDGCKSIAKPTSEQLAEQKDTALDVKFNDEQKDEDCEFTSKHASEENIHTMHMVTKLKYVYPSLLSICVRPFPL